MSGSPVQPVALVVLAAGMGRRFGALKQVCPLGPGGEAIADFTIHDAIAAGVTEVVVVVRPEIRSEVVGHLQQRCPLTIKVVDQPGPLPPRVKPWGASEAVALALAHLDTDLSEGGLDGRGFAVVVNADDHYGADSLKAAVHWAAETPADDRGALVTWPLEATTSAEGGVSRAICRLDSDGRLLGMVEHHDIVSDSAGARDSSGPLARDAPVSMNLWALPNAIGPALASTVERFKARHAADSDAELALPTAIDSLVAAGAVSVTTLAAGTTWVGVTHPGDLEPARDSLAHLPTLPILESR